MTVWTMTMTMAIDNDGSPTLLAWAIVDLVSMTADGPANPTDDPTVVIVTIRTVLVDSDRKPRHGRQQPASGNPATRRLLVIDNPMSKRTAIMAKQ